MDCSSLPNFPNLRKPDRADKAAQDFSLRRAWLLRDLALLVAIVALLCWLRWAATEIEHPPAPRSPVAFGLIEERFGQLHWGATYAEVEELLGPASPIKGEWDPDLQRWMEHAPRELDPAGNRCWDVWIDPNDESRGVAILFVGGKVSYIAKKGF